MKKTIKESDSISSFLKKEKILYFTQKKGQKKMKKKFKCEIDCAACAAKVEDAIKKLEGVNDATVNFMMQKFTLDADDEKFDSILQKAIEVGKKIEPDFSVEFKK